MTNYDKLIYECDKSITFYTNHLTTLRKHLETLDNARKLVKVLNPNSKFEVFDEIEKFNNYNGYITISMLELSVTCKNICLAKTDWEKIFFIKYSYLIIHETISKLNSQNNTSNIKRILNDKYPLLNERFLKALNNIEVFKMKNNYKKIETTRHYTAGHIEKNLRKYYDTVKELNGEETAIVISEFLRILNEMLIITRDYVIYANNSLEKSNRVFDDNLSKMIVLINEMFKEK